MTPQLLVLWDIDGTLVRTHGLGTELTGSAFESATGRRREHLPNFAGSTDIAIFRDTLDLHGMPRETDGFEVFAAHLVDGHRRRIGEMRERGRVLPGAGEALRALAGRDGVRQTLVTGNVRGVAELKMAAFGLADHLDLDAGAYGDEHEERHLLVRAALDRSQAGAAEAVVVGDTPSDVAAAHACGVRAVTVATGRFTAEQLHAAGADTVLPSLADTAAVLREVAAAG